MKHAPGSQPDSSCRAGDSLWSDPGWCGASSALGLGWDRFKLCHLATVPGATPTGACWRGAGTANAPFHSSSGGRDGIKAVWHGPNGTPWWGTLRHSRPESLVIILHPSSGSIQVTQICKQERISKGSKGEISEDCDEFHCEPSTNMTLRL